MEYQKKLRGILSDKKQTKNQVLAAIKKQVAAGEYEYALNSNPVIRASKLNPENHSLSLGDIQQRPLHRFTVDLKKELYWLMYDVISAAPEINQFLELKSQFERHFLLSEFEKALKVVETVKTSFGENLWTVEMQLLVKENTAGTKENWSILSDHLLNIRSAFYQFLLNFYSKRIEENMSFENCMTQFQSDYDGVVSDHQVKDFLVFKSVPLARYDYSFSNLEGVLFISGIFPTIDKYLTIVETLQKLTATSRKQDRLVLSAVTKLLDHIKDNRLENIRFFLSPANTSEISLYTREIMPVIDYYSQSQYDRALHESLSMLKKHPDIFELYEIHAKSLICLSTEFKETGISGVVDRLLLNVYNSLLFNESSEKFKKNLLKYSLTFSNFSFSRQISAFALSLRNDVDQQDSILSILSSKFHNPRIFTVQPPNIEQHKKFYLDQLDSTTLNINLYASGFTNKIEHVSNQTQLDVYHARHAFSVGKFDTVISICEQIDQHKAPAFYLDNILYLLFQSYLKTDKLIEAAIFSAAIISEKSVYTSKLDFSQLTDLINSRGVDAYAHRIETPIVFSNVYKDYDLYEVYSEFMLSLPEEYPSRLDVATLSSLYSKDKVIYFLRDVCKLSTIRYSLEFKSITDAEQERLNICQLLKQIDNKNTLQYESEISDILRTSSVRKVIKEVDEGRLYVNIEALKKSQLTNLSESFNRYKEIENATKEKTLKGFNSSRERNWTELEFQPSDNSDEISNPSFLAFKSIYLDTRDRFLFSKEYGLDSCLSTRIRHGALKNHIRSVFEKLSLVTSKSGGTYTENTRWLNVSADSTTDLKVQARLKHFSKEVDDFTTFIVDNLIQIQTERQHDKKDGLLNYFTNDQILLKFYNEHKDRFSSVNAIIEILYTDLVTYTFRNVCLHVYKTFIEEINTKYQYFIDSLNNDLRKLDLGNQSELLGNIMRSSTNIQRELEIIAEWFAFSTTSSSSLIDIETLLNASIEYTNQINPTFSFRPKLTFNCDPFLGYSDLIFVFNIMLNNIIAHCKLEAPTVVVEIIVDRVDQFVVTTFKNSISEDVDIIEIHSKLKTVKENWNDHSRIERSNIEGESGFDKIKRILLYEAFAKSDRFEFNIENRTVSISLFFPFTDPTKK